jgi:hypothetical protein
MATFVSDCVFWVICETIERTQTGLFGSVAFFIFAKKNFKDTLFQEDEKPKPGSFLILNFYKNQKTKNSQQIIKTLNLKHLVDQS